MKGGIDASLPLRIDSIDGAYALNKTYYDSIKQSLKMIILTSPGEKIFRPSFGVGLRSYLFNQVNPADIYLIRDNIINQITIYMPYLLLQEVNVEYIDQEPPGLKVGISYQVNDSIAFEDYFELTV
jgi:phage baseplate assembly protein W